MGFAQAAELSVITAGLMVLFQTVKGAQRIAIARVTTATVGLHSDAMGDAGHKSGRLFGSGKMFVSVCMMRRVITSCSCSLDSLCCHQNCCARLAPQFWTG